MRTYLFVAYHLATANLAKARKNELQILAARHGIELAHKEHVLWRLDVGVRQVADDLERERCSCSLVPPPLAFRLFGVLPLLLCRGPGCRLLRRRLRL